MVILPTFPPGASLTKGHSFTGSEGHSGKVGPEGPDHGSPMKVKTSIPGR